MWSFLQRTLLQALALSDSSSSTDNDTDDSKSSEVAAAPAEEEKPNTEVTVTVTESKAVPQKLFTVDSPNETSSSGSTENDFEIVSNENSPIASPTIMAEHTEQLNFGLGDEIEDTDKFTKNLNPKGVSEMELREKRQRLRWAYMCIVYILFLIREKNHIRLTIACVLNEIGNINNRKKHCPSSIRTVSAFWQMNWQTLDIYPNFENHAHTHLLMAERHSFALSLSFALSPCNAKQHWQFWQII